MDSLSCSRCGASRDLADNFCRRCGHALTINLPAVSATRLPVAPPPAKAIPPSIIGSVAVLAMGTGLEWLARRMAGSAARAAGRAIIGQERSLAPRRGQPEPQTVTVDEVLYVRKIELRR